MRRRSPTVSLLCLALALVTVRAEAAGRWTRLRSPNFTLEGDVPDRDLQAVARRLEQFREVLGRQLPKARLVTPSPLSVLVFAHDRDFKPIKPLFEGKPIDVAGYFIVTQIGTTIALCLEGGERAYPTIYHEYGHLLISNALPRLPLWLEEGLAEYYGTFQLSADRKRAVIGRPIPLEELNLLRGRPLLPVSEQLKVDHQSRIYNVGMERSRFYAQCWALVHYLLLGNAARSTQFADYVNRLAGGADANDAFTAAFPGGAAALQEEVTDYVHNLTFSAQEIRFPDQVGGARSFSAGAMTAAEVEASFGHMLLKQRRYEEAESRFREALELDPATGAAHTGLGLARVLQDHPIEALPFLRRGAELDEGSAMAHFALGFGAMHCGVPGCEKEQGGDETARREFLRAIELLPEFPDALSYLGFAEMSNRADLETAERHVLAAVALLPGRQNYRLHLAQIYLRQENFARAQAVLGPIAASGQPEFRAGARQLLGTLAEMRNAKAAREAEAATNPPGLSATTPAAPGAPGPGLPRATSPTGTIPVFRTRAPGEQRLEGLLESIECGRSGLAVAIRAGGATRRFAAASFDALELITYRDDLKGTVSCGAQGGLPVYLTWRAPAAAAARLPAGIEGVAVAIEFLPKGK